MPDRSYDDFDNTDHGWLLQQQRWRGAAATGARADRPAEDYGPDDYSHWRREASHDGDVPVPHGRGARGRDYPRLRQDYSVGDEHVRDDGFWGHSVENYPQFARKPDHRGRGPKGYRRSDERIAEEVHARLTEARDIDASDIEVQVEEGVVSLRGQVGDRRTRRAAEDVVLGIGGVSQVQNDLRIGGRGAQVSQRTESTDGY